MAGKMTIPLQKGIIYGPVKSRRLGRSLGINVVSTKVKTCTFNCLYCQYGLRRAPDAELKNSNWYPPATRITTKLAEVLGILDGPPAYLTFSGNGEATLHPAFPEIVREVIKIRNLHCPEALLAILSNSSTVIDERIRHTLGYLDRRIMKLDCGDENNFIRFNQPIEGIRFFDIIGGLKSLEDVIIQALFAGGSAGNYHAGNIGSWLEVLTEISPSSVQIYTLDRPYPSKMIQPLEKAKLLLLKKEVLKRGIEAEVY